MRRQKYKNKRDFGKERGIFRMLKGYKLTYSFSLVIVGMVQIYKKTLISYNKDLILLQPTLI